jgi:hypothetical protein
MNQPEMKFAPPRRSGTKSLQATFGDVKKAVLLQVGKNLQVGWLVAIRLREMQHQDLDGEKPIRAVSEEKDPEDRTLEQQGLDMIYKVKMEFYFKRVDNLRRDLRAASELIYSDFCTEEMQRRVDEHCDVRTTPHHHDPIQLLEVIEHMMLYPQELPRKVESTGASPEAAESTRENKQPKSALLAQHNGILSKQGKASQSGSREREKASTPISLPRRLLQEWTKL